MTLSLENCSLARRFLLYYEIPGLYGAYRKDNVSNRSRSDLRKGCHRMFSWTFNKDRCAPSLQATRAETRLTVYRAHASFGRSVTPFEHDLLCRCIIKYCCRATLRCSPFMRSIFSIIATVIDTDDELYVKNIEKLFFRTDSGQPRDSHLRSAGPSTPGRGASHHFETIIYV